MFVLLNSGSPNRHPRHLLTYLHLPYDLSTYWHFHFIPIKYGISNIKSLNLWVFCPQMDHIGLSMANSLYHLSFSVILSKMYGFKTFRRIHLFLSLSFSNLLHVLSSTLLSSDTFRMTKCNTFYII